MILEPQVNDNTAPIEAAEAKEAIRNDGLYSDDPALRLCVADAIKAENFAQSKAWILNWNGASLLYQSPESPRYWQGTNVPAASVPFFTVATAVNSLVPQITTGLFFDTPPFLVQERPGTTGEAARAIQALLGYQLEDIDFEPEVTLGVTNAVTFGTGIWKWGWEKFTKTRKIFKTKNPPVPLDSSIPGLSIPPLTDDDLDEEVTEEVVDRPTFEHIVNLRQVLVDPGLNVPDIRKAKYVIHRLYMTWKDLNKLRDRPGFNIPSESKLLELFLPPVEEPDAAVQEEGTKNPQLDARAAARWDDTSINPLEDPLEVLERWDNETYTCVLQKKLVLCNDLNPYGKIPFFSINWWDVPEAFWGMGVARTIGAEQRLQQGITNIWLDQASLNLNGVYVRVRGKSIPTQNIRVSPGKIIEVDDPKGFLPLDRQPAVPEAGQHLQMSQARAEQVSGANETATQGIAGASGHSNMARSSAGAQALSAGAGSRPAFFVGKLSTQVIVPWLYEMYEMDKAMLPVSQLKYILSDELQHDYLKNGGDIIDLLNARVKFSVLAGAKMQTRRNMAQALPLVVQFVTNQQTENQLALQSKKVDIAELIRLQFEAADLKSFNDVIVDMTPEDTARWQQMQNGPAAAKIQGAQSLQQQKFEQEQQLLDQANEARAGRDVLREEIKKSVEPEALTGAPDPNGLGSF